MITILTQGRLMSQRERGILLVYYTGNTGTKCIFKKYKSIELLGEGD